MDKTWYSKAIHFKLDCYLPAYVNETLTLKCWSNATKNQINCQIFRDNECLSAFSITYNPNMQHVTKLLPLNLDVVDKDFIKILFNKEQMICFRDRFNQLDLWKFMTIFVEDGSTALRYGLWGIPELITGNKGSIISTSSCYTYDPSIYNMDRNTRLQLLVKLSSVGDSSFISKCELTDCKTQTIVHEARLYTIFMIDGKIKMIPDSFKNKLLRYVPKKESNEKVTFYYSVYIKL